ncbi:MAG: hypothetical protein WC614_07735 [bacterium]
MPDIYIIMGTNNTRKSSVVRALTGVCQRGIYQISTRSGDIDVFVQISALQEAGILPNQFTNEIKGIVCGAVLVPLHVGGKNNGLQYINAFVTAGWNIKHISLFGITALPYPLPSGICSPFPISTTRTDPANKTASVLRNNWMWL